MTRASETEKPHYYGHRARLRERFLRGGGDALQDYEMLEMLLGLALPRRDIKPLAKSLLEKFGSYSEVISAPVERLTEVKGLGDTTIAALKVAQASAQRLAREDVINKQILSNWKALLDYCRSVMAYESNEQFRILFLNQKNVLIADELQQKGTVNHTPVYPREVIKRALELGASAIILTHNHPSGDPTPSKDDIAMTKEIIEIGAKLGVMVHDHLVIGKAGHSSFKSLGII